MCTSRFLHPDSKPVGFNNEPEWVQQNIIVLNDLMVVPVPPDSEDNPEFTVVKTLDEWVLLAEN